MLEQLEQVVADAGLVVVDIAGREDRHLARCELAVNHLACRAGLLGGPAEALDGQFRHPGVWVHTECAVHQAACELGLVDRVDRLHHHRDASKAAVHIGRCQQLLGRTDPPGAEFDRLGTQHQVRKIQLPGVRRHIRALHHIAQVAEIALVDNIPVSLFLDAVYLTILGRIDQVEQGGKALAQADTAPASVADVEHPLHLGETSVLIVELRVLPVQRMAGGRFEVAFAGTHGLGPGVLKIWDEQRSGTTNKGPLKTPCVAAKPPEATGQSTSASRAF